MEKSEDLRKLQADLERCLAEADRLKMDMAGIYISHAIEHVSYVEATRSPATVLRAVQGGNRDE